MQSDGIILEQGSFAELVNDEVIEITTGWNLTYTFTIFKATKAHSRCRVVFIEGPGVRRYIEIISLAKFKSQIDQFEKGRLIIDDLINEYAVEQPRWEPGDDEINYEA